MLSRKFTTDEVYGVNRDVPLNYVARKLVDEKFVSSLSRSQHIVVHGSSKQGKTSLRKHCLDDNDYVVVSCINRWGLVELNGAILKAAGFETRRTTEIATSGVAKIAVTVKGRAGVPFFAEGEAGGDVSGEAARAKSVVTAPISLDPTDVNDLIGALQSISFKKYIVLEDFHYLSNETQKDFSFALKAIHENSNLTFIIVGVWKEENRLIGFNGDLTERVLSVNADEWSEAELRQVVQEGAELLNIEIDGAFQQQLLELCYDSVHIVQEVCRRVCRAEGIFNTQGERKSVGENSDARAYIADVVSEQAGRYMNFLVDITDGFQETEKQMPKWVVYAILCSSVEQLEVGIRQRSISKLIKAKHPDGSNLNNGNIAQILKSITSLQNKKSIRPIVIDYNVDNNKLNVVDKGFLIWLASQDVAEVLEDLGLPDAIAIEDVI